MLAFLAARAVPATEQVAGLTYHRSLRGGKDLAAANDDDAASGPLAGTARITDEPQRQALRVELSDGLAGGEAGILQRLQRMFDVDCDPQAIACVLGELAASDPGLRLPGSVDPFEIVVRAILGQQVTVAAARTIASRFVAHFGAPLPVAGRLSHLFPLASTVAGLEASRLGEIGIIRARGEAIIAVAGALGSGKLKLQPGAAVEPALACLTAIRGIGPWTAHYVAMRTLGWRDAFPPGDVVVLKALQTRTAAQAVALAQRWQPWRAYAVLHLWRRIAAGAG
jgi:AraC family transcriptional regulator of adaptative response / DNA-3-methyladenine glycosylase II